MVLPQAVYDDHVEARVVFSEPWLERGSETVGALSWAKRMNNKRLFGYPSIFRSIEACNFANMAKTCLGHRRLPQYLDRATEARIQ